MDIDIGFSGMLFTYALLLPGLWVLWYYRTGLVGRTLYAVLRMSLQLVLVGVYLKYIFELRSLWVNFLWLGVMVSFACGATISQSGLHWRSLLVPCWSAIGLTGIGTVLYFVAGITGKSLDDAAMVIPIAGMLLGNSMRSNIVALERFYSSLVREEEGYLLRILYGAKRREALLPYIREALKAALGQNIASMITLGLVSLPGMMSGQLLGGSPPWVAIKYQIAIMIGIFSVMAVASALLIEFSIPGAFAPDGTLNRRIFRTGRVKA